MHSDPEVTPAQQLGVYDRPGTQSVRALISSCAVARPQHLGQHNHFGAAVAATLVGAAQHAILGARNFFFRLERRNNWGVFFFYIAVVGDFLLYTR